MAQNFLHQLSHGSARGSIWPKVEGEIDFAQVVSAQLWLRQDRCEPQVTTERLKHVLPWAHRGFVAHGYGPAFLQCASAIGHDAVRGPVAATDHVARARTGDLDRTPGKK